MCPHPATSPWKPIEGPGRFSCQLFVTCEGNETFPINSVVNSRGERIFFANQNLDIDQLLDVGIPGFGLGRTLLTGEDAFPGVSIFGVTPPPGAVVNNVTAPNGILVTKFRVRRPRKCPSHPLPASSARSLPRSWD